MTKVEYDSIQCAFDAHLMKALCHYHLTREGKTVYENAVAACKSILSRTAVKDWEKKDGGAEE